MSLYTPKPGGEYNMKLNPIRQVGEQNMILYSGLQVGASSAYWKTSWTPKL